MNVIDLLISQHRDVENLFSAYTSGDHSTGPMIVQSLELHTKIEETLVYPAIRQYVDGGNEMIDHAEDEHNAVKELLNEFKTDFNNTEVFTKIKEDVLHHVEEEETEVFPALRESCSEEYLKTLGEQAQQINL
jgi:iron-sulfur cluster repair protein YtfE (RIC family)